MIEEGHACEGGVLVKIVFAESMKRVRSRTNDAGLKQDVVG
jgi:hypothetical protein